MNVKLVIKQTTIEITDEQRAALLSIAAARGEKGFSAGRLPSGVYNLRLEMDGYDPFATEVEILRDITTDHQFTLGTAGTEAWRARCSRAQGGGHSRRRAVDQPGTILARGAVSGRYRCRQLPGVRCPRGV